MRLFMRSSAEKSLQEFDDKIDTYFKTSRKYRSKLRRGSVVLLDEDPEMFKFLNFIVEKCSLPIGVVHVASELCAMKIINDIGSNNVKAVIINEKFLGDCSDPNSFSMWVREQFPKIPVWVTDCNPERTDFIKSKTSRIGVIQENEPLTEVAMELGFPEECLPFALAYTG
jgi:hypothetical protein